MTPASLRCAACGNRTRFDIYETVRRRRFAHYTLGGEVTVEEEEILDHAVERVVCRWCERSDAIEQDAGEWGNGEQAGETAG